ncbi:unnamed protein product [Parnassius apollo]|uniref:(apollo) hypothetical protein n=1 Tax=Parnassius apollo TaxID=110799 RepID=A0A8S3XVD1_PARAO|nr:unnamed protein product [Parnassius apollo]
MEFTSIVLPLTKNMCRTCLAESDSTLFMSVQDLIDHEIYKIKLIDILIFLNCVENNDEDNWPQGMCTSCVNTALLSYNFKINCLKTNLTLSQISTVQSSSTTLQRSDVDTIDINVVYQDHEYDTPLFSNHTVLDFEPHVPVNKELTPLPPVSEITSTERPPRKEGFATSSGLKIHKESHTNTEVCCNICNKNFVNRRVLQKHMKVHDINNVNDDIILETVVDFFNE